MKRVTREGRCTFEVLIEDFRLSDPADDHEKLRLQFPIYDALYAFRRDASS